VLYKTALQWRHARPHPQAHRRPEKTVEWLQKNWDVLASAPFVFAGCVVGSFGVAFAVISYFKNSEITRS
jgi:hypothetical protein